MNTALSSSGVSDKYSFSANGKLVTLSRLDGLNFQPYKGGNQTASLLFYDGVDIRTGGGQETIKGATANKVLVTTDGRLAVEREIEISVKDSYKLVQLMTCRDLSNSKIGNCYYVPLIDIKV